MSHHSDRAGFRPLDGKFDTRFQPLQRQRPTYRVRLLQLQRAELGHDGFGFGRLGVGDVDGVVGLFRQVAQLLDQCGGREVAADAGQFFFVAAEGGFDHQGTHGQLRDALPEGGAGTGVAAEDPGAGAAVDGQAHCRHSVLGWQDLDLLAQTLKAVAGFEGQQFDERTVRAGQAGEVGPDDVVEDVAAQGVQGGGQGSDLQGLAAALGDGVDHQGQSSDVVQMRVGEQDLVDVCHLLQAQVADAGAGIDQKVVVHQERGGAATLGDGARAPQDADSQRCRCGFLAHGVLRCGWMKGNGVVSALPCASAHLLSMMLTPSQGRNHNLPSEVLATCGW